MKKKKWKMDRKRFSKLNFLENIRCRKPKSREEN